MSENNVVIVVAVLAVIASLAAAGLSYYTALTGQNLISGLATSTSTGTANLTIESAIQINFSINSINWGSGRVNAGKDYAVLDSDGTVFQGNWTTVSQGLVLDNLGNVNVTLNLETGKNAAQFIGGGAGAIPDPVYQWKITENLTDSCINATGPAYGYNAYATVNSTAGGTLFCNPFQFGTNKNKLNIDINITVPVDAAPGLHGDIITATAVG